MTDYRRIRGPQDARIDMNRAAQVEYWTSELDIDAETLKRVVDEIGPAVDDVVAYLVRNPACRPAR
jgi:hypothetical protein